MEQDQKTEVEIPKVAVANVITGIFLVGIAWRLKRMHNTLGLLTAMVSANNFQLQELEQSSIDARTLLDILANTKGSE